MPGPCRLYHCPNEKDNTAAVQAASSPANVQTHSPVARTTPMRAGMARTLLSAIGGWLLAPNAFAKHD